MHSKSKTKNESFGWLHYIRLREGAALLFGKLWAFLFLLGRLTTLRRRHWNGAAAHTAVRVTVFTRDRTLVRLAWIMQHYIPSGLVQQKDCSRALRGRGGGRLVRGGRASCPVWELPLRSKSYHRAYRVPLKQSSDRRTDTAGCPA